MAESTAARIPERWVTPVRIAVALSVLLHLGLFLAGIGPRFAELTQPCVPSLCEPLEPTAADITALEQLGLTVTQYAVFHIAIEVALVVVCLALIGLLFWRASHLWIGAIAILAVISIAVTVANVVYALGEAAPWTYPLFALAELSGNLGLFLLYYLFPDGRFYPRWTRWILIVFIPILAVGGILGGSDYIETPLTGTLVEIGPIIGLLGLMSTAVVTQVIRYRSYYDNQQRQQARWMITAMAGLIFGGAGWLLLFEFQLIPPGPARIVTSFLGMTVLMLFSVGLIPYALTIAILRHQLWNIDIIIRRTLQYGVISAVLGAVYFGSIVVVQGIFRGLTGTESSLGVVLSTLLIAALFQPVREQVQQFIDRRFFRRRYDAEQTLAQFAEAMRDEVDLDEIRAQLLSTVAHTLEPERVSLIMVQEADDG